MDDNKAAVLIFLILSISITAIVVGVTYNKSMEVKYATENGYREEIINGRKIWMKDGRE